MARTDILRSSAARTLTEQFGVQVGVQNNKQMDAVSSRGMEKQRIICKRLG